MVVGRRRWRARLVVVFVLGALLATAPSLYALGLPKPTGAYAVGRTHQLLVDESRPESRTPRSGDHRTVPVTLWYPAEPDTGSPAPYVQDLGEVADGLVASGELSRATVLGLRAVRDAARLDAVPAGTAEGRFPLLLLSPGNATNVGFYAALAEELASAGYVVVGVDHPFQSTAVLTSDGSVAVYSGEIAPSAERTQELLAERVKDLRFALDEATRHAGTWLGGIVDVDHVGALGHSNGGLAAVQLCRDDARVDACLNIDGQNRNGPLPASGAPAGPGKPFAVLTKEPELHPTLRTAFDEAARTDDTYRIIVEEAQHQDFADGPSLSPTLNPFPRSSRQVLAVARSFTRAFFDHTLRHAPRSVFAGLDAPTDIVLEVYPLTASGPRVTPAAAR